jgi:hypothetical protein
MGRIQIESENRVLRGVFGFEKDDVAEGQRILHSEELRNLFSLNIITINKRIRLKRMNE